MAGESTRRGRTGPRRWMLISLCALLAVMVLIGTCQSEIPRAIHSQTDGPDCSSRGLPQSGVLIGAAVGGNTDPAELEQAIGGTLAVRRTYWRPDQINKALKVARSDLAIGRLPWISFKLPHSWSEMATGAGDDWARKVATGLSHLDGPVWIAFNHEPEGDGNIKEWVYTQRRLSPIVRGIASNAAFTIILTGWNQLYGPSQYSFDALWPGDGLIDVLGVDVYDSYGVVKSGVQSTQRTEMQKTYFEKIAAFAHFKNVKWAVAETGYTDAAANVDPEWMSRTVGEVAESGGAAFVYFDSTLNSAASWSLHTPAKWEAFASVLKRSPRC